MSRRGPWSEPAKRSGTSAEDSRIGSTDQPKAPHAVTVGFAGALPPAGGIVIIPWQPRALRIRQLADRRGDWWGSRIPSVPDFMKPHRVGGAGDLVIVRLAGE
jgi:hypothetical protein